MRRILLVTLFLSSFLCISGFSQTNVFPASGNVGIGTTSPTSTLFVRGDVVVRRTDANNYLRIHADVNGVYLTSDDPATNQKNLFIRAMPTGSNSTDRSIIFQTGKSSDILQSRMTVTGSGNVGIGTLTPTQRLEVNGTVKAREINVTTTGWPDYVFRPEYKLMPLTELKNYIQVNGHLPNIPSETDVMKQGINLGDINVKLLEKVEELTLYLIDQQRELESQKLIIQEQSKNIGLLLKQMENYSAR